MTRVGKRMSLYARLRRIFELQDPQHARLLTMEGLRGVAVTLVFLQHYTVQARLIGVPAGPGAGFVRLFSAWGNLGVELFFVLSGFLIYGTLVRKRPGFRAFMRRRCQRIFPAFLVVFAFALAQCLLYPVGKSLPHSLFTLTLVIAANLALLPGLFPIMRIVDVAWSLSYEMFFYIATAAAAGGLGLGSFSQRRRIAGLIILAAGFQSLIWLKIPYFPVRMLPFIAGMLLAEDAGNWVPRFAAWMFPLADLIATWQHVIPPGIAEAVHSLSFFALCSVCFRDTGVASVAMKWTPLRWLGNMSYSYYLAHGFIVRFGMLELGRVLPGGLTEGEFWGLMPVAFAATLLASALLFILIEKPLSLATSPPNASALAPNWAAIGAHGTETLK